MSLTDAIVKRDYTRLHVVDVTGVDVLEALVEIATDWVMVAGRPSSALRTLAASGGEGSFAFASSREENGEREGRRAHLQACDDESLAHRHCSV